MKRESDKRARDRAKREKRERERERERAEKGRRNRESVGYNFISNSFGARRGLSVCRSSTRKYTAERGGKTWSKKGGKKEGGVDEKGCRGKKIMDPHR